ncbi:MAG: ABC transporter ATP-binding protein [Candidatus Muiribacteriota bacterium]
MEKIKNSRIYYFKWILNIYREHKFFVFVLFLLTIFTTAVTTLYPLVFKFIIDALVENLEMFESGKASLDMAVKERNKLLLVLFGFGIGMILTNIYPYLRGRMNMKLEITLRKIYFKSILNKSYRFFLKFRTGDIATRLTDDLSTHPPGISWFLCSGIFRAFNSSFIILFCIISMMFLNLKLALLSIIPIPLMVMVYFKLESIVEEKFSNYRDAVSKTNDFLESAYSGIKIIKSFNSEIKQNVIFSEELDRRKIIETELLKTEGLFSIYFEFINYVCQLLVLLFGGIMVIKGEITIGTYIAFYSYLGMIVWPLLDIPHFFVRGTQALVTIDRLDEISDFEKSYSDENQGSIILGKADNVTFENVCFNYVDNSENKTSDKTFHLNNINFSVKNGEKIAIVGKIGAGKTTLLNLLTGIYQPTSGNILINGKDISLFDKNSFREKLGFIQQTPTIISENVKTNIDFWRNSSDFIIKEAAQTAQFLDEIEKLPQKFDTTLGQNGIGLSGGQKQRLSIARALCGNPDILIMDDVTSALDAENEMEFWQNLLEKNKNITCIIVTHRLSTAKNADRIFVLNHGQIEATGTHEELLKISRTYQELVAS